jgi:hypothetical protein
MQLLAENRGKGKTEMLSNTVTCAPMLSSPCFGSARRPLRLSAARMHACAKKGWLEKTRGGLLNRMS